MCLRPNVFCLSSVLSLIFLSSVAVAEETASVREAGLTTSSTETTKPRNEKSFQLNEEGVALIFEGKRDEGRAKIEAALEHDPTNATALYNLAGLYLSEGEAAAAIEKMKSAIQMSPSDPSFLNRLAEAYFASNNVDMAIASYEKLAKQNPSYDQTLLRLGTLYSMQGQLPRAEKVFKTAIRLNVADRRVLHGLGTVLVAQGKFQEAVPILREAQKENATAETAEVMAVAFEGLKRWKHALRHYEKAKELGSTSPDLEEKISALSKAVNSQGTEKE